uniref:Cell adhesion molecule 3-like n=1 Tax=Saccoglossus kowalevskii TaxID=10224 RepID=A0ABM0LYT4_SACKO
MLTGNRALAYGYCVLTIGATICYSFDVVGPTDIDILLGEDATLNCVITDFAGSVGKWSKVNDADEIFIALSSGGYIGTGHDSTKHSDWSVATTGTNNYDLKIPNVDINDDGCYFCGIGTADASSMSNTCGNVRIIVPLSSRPVFTNYNHRDTVMVTRNAMTTFICTTSGTKPASTIEWYIGSTQITNGITTSDTSSNGLYDTT